MSQEENIKKLHHELRLTFLWNTDYATRDVRDQQINFIIRSENPNYYIIVGRLFLKEAVD